MKYACIDIGTNAVLLAIVGGADLVDILDISTITRLGEGLRGTGELSASAMERTFKVLQRYENIIRENKVDKIFCVGTAVLRDASNSKTFVDMVEKRLGFRINIITEKEEALYTFGSACVDSSIGEGSVIISDIGGGSTEIIKGDKGCFLGAVSLPVGSVKLTEMFVKNDPPTINELEALRDYVLGLLDTPFCAGIIPDIFVGTGGTVTIVAGIIKGLQTFEKEKVHGCKIKLNDIKALIAELKRLTSHERVMIKGMEIGREDILLQGTILLEEIMKRFEKDEMLVSANGVRYGVIFEALGKIS